MTPRGQIIIAVVAEHYELTPADLVSRRRHGELVEARHIARYLCLELLDWTVGRCAREWGCEHGSIAASRRTVEARRATEPRFRTHYDSLHIVAATRLNG